MVASWTKYFNDGTCEIGSDDLILKKEASWSRGKLSNIKEVFLSDSSISGLIEIFNTEWFQFDRYRAILDSSPKSTRIARYLQALITEEHVGLYLCYNNNSIRVNWLSLKKKPINHNYYKISDIDVGQWITLELQNNNPTIFLGNRGSLNGKQLFR